MWIFTDSGFISAVLDDPSTGTVKVRARDAQSLQPLVTRFRVDVHRSPHADYPYRVFLTRDQLAEHLADTALAIDYGNFKSQVYATRGSKFAHALSDVWSTMHDVEDGEARR